MTTILLQESLHLEEIGYLRKEFPHYELLSTAEGNLQELSIEEWNEVEIIYGNTLSSTQFGYAHQLRWIHSPTPDLQDLCLQELQNQSSVLITHSQQENVSQIGEFILGAILGFAKNLFYWGHFQDSKMRESIERKKSSMWTLKDKILLQIGLGSIGTEIARLAKQMNMRVLGVQSHRTFHPYCHKTISLKDLRSALPRADVVCISLPRGKSYQNWFKKEELELLKEDSILIVTGYSDVVDEEALLNVIHKGKLRGVVLDNFYQKQIASSTSRAFWHYSNVLHTPNVAAYPKQERKQSFAIFKYNLRQYLGGNFSDMKNLIDSTLDYTFF